MKEIIVSIFRWFIAMAALGAILLSPASVQAAPEALQYYSRDNFSSVAYNNNDGPVNWGGDWTELNDDTLPTSGNVQITAGGELRIDNHDVGSLEGIYRPITNLSGATQATLYFDHRTSNTLENTDTFRIGVSTDDCGTVTVLETLSDDSQGSRVYNITPYLADDLVVCMQVTVGYTGANEYIYFNAIQVTYYIPSVHTATSIVQTVQTYYIPLPEDQLYTINTTIYPTSCGDQGIFNLSLPVETYVSIAVVSNGTIIYYDHWEDGFEVEVNLPSQDTSEVWGDREVDNGAPPGVDTDSEDVLTAGTVIILRNPVMPATRQTVYDYDGGDKLASTEPVAVTRLGWNAGSDTLMATAEEMLDTSVWGTYYDVPVGQNTDTARAIFEYTGAAIMAGQDGTGVYLNGSLLSTLDQGESYLINGGLNAGNVITSTAPVQVQLYTGDVCANFESRSYTLYPTDLWSSNYYNPVSAQTSGTDTTPSTSVYLFNPGTADITVNWSTFTGSQPPQTVLARSVTRVLIPVGEGSRFYTPGGEPFFAVAAVDANLTVPILNGYTQNYDWGYTLVPASQLTQQALVGFGMGHDPTKSSTENGAPVWVTAVMPPGKTGTAPYDVCVDYDGDALGPLTDANDRNYDLLLDDLDELESRTVYDDDGDQTGMLLYVCGDDDGEARIAVAWGEDPAEASTGTPGLDSGTSVPPLPDFVAVKGAELTDDVQDNGLFDVGDTFAYNILIKNSGALPVPAGVITVTDIVPTYTLYVPNSTTIDNGTTIVSITDNLPPSTIFPLDVAGYTVTQTLPIEGVFTVTFQVKINPSLPGSVRIQNQAQVSGLDLTFDPQVEIIVNPPDETSLIGDFVWLDLDGDGVQDAGEPGIPGITLELWDGTCTPSSTCLTDVTDSYGEYGFPNLFEGVAYTVVVSGSSLPAGLTQTGDPDQPGIPCTACDAQHTVILNAGNKPYLDADFGYQGNVSIGDFVWYDFDGDGVQDGGVETGLSDVAITLTYAGVDGNLATATDNITFTTATSGGGAYDFTHLPAGTYQVDLDETTLPAGYTLTTSDTLTLANLPASTDYNDADFGANFRVTIGDTIWLDLDGDGTQDANEPGLSGVDVELNNGSCTVGVDCPTDTTDSNGNYSFDDLSAGTYTVIVHTATLPGGVNQTGDPDATLDHQHTVYVTEPGDHLEVDFGYQGTGSIGDRIWNDIDGDGAQDAGEGGISDVVAWLDLDSDGVRDSNEPTDTTDANGTYVITGLPAGTYSVRVDTTTLPTGVTQTGDPDATCPGANCNHRTSVTLTAGQDYILADFGYQFAALSISKVSSAGGTVDPGDTITYTIVVRNNTASQHTGIAITDAVPSGTTYVTGSVTGYQQYEYRDDFITGGGYNQTAGLSDWSAGGLTPWTENNDDGSPTGGTIRIVGSNLLRLRNANGDSIQRTIPGNLTGQTVTLEIDYSESSTLEAGDWFYVEMWNGTGWTAVISLENDFGNPAAQTRDISSYARNGDTRIRIRSTYNGETGTNEDAFVDYVRIYYSVNVIGGAIHTPPNIIVAGDNFALNAGQTMQVTYRVLVANPVAAGIGSIDNTASVVSTQQPTPQYASTQDDLPPANLGNWVWHDANDNGLQDGGETGISGVTVYLYEDADGDGVAEPGGDDGTSITSDVTDASGNYQFANILAGHYFLVFEQPTGYTYATANVGGDDNIDSDAGTGGATTVYLLSSGETNNSFDAGLRSTLDYGDLPSSDYETLLSQDGARHVAGTLRLGSGTTSVEGDGQPDTNASRDTYDDGVTRQPGLNGASNNGGWTVGTVAAGEGGSLNITISGGSGVPQVFIDFGNGSGGSTGTLTQVTLRNSSGTALTMPLAVGTHQVYFDIPGDTFGASIQPLALRVRLSSSGGLSETGLASDGEVEDYVFRFGPTAVSLASFSARSSAGIAIWLALLVAVAALAVTGMFWRLSRRRVR